MENVKSRWQVKRVGARVGCKVLVDFFICTQVGLFTDVISCDNKEQIQLGKKGRKHP